MKLKLVYIVNSIILFLITSPLMAQDPLADPGDDPDTIPAAPIDDYVMVLALIGLIFVFIKFRAIQKKKIEG
jgi:hypothetical protein